MFLVVPDTSVLLKTVSILEAVEFQDANPGAIIVKVEFPDGQQRSAIASSMDASPAPSPPDSQ